MIIFVYAMKQLGVPIVRKRALNTKIQNVMTLCLAPDCSSVNLKQICTCMMTS